MQLKPIDLSLAMLIAASSLSSCSPAGRMGDDAARGDLAAVKADLANTPVDAQNLAGNTALGSAAGSGRLEVVKLLLASGAKVNGPGSEGDTPLMDAVNGPTGGDAPGVVAALIAAGADPSAKDRVGRTPGTRASCPCLSGREQA